MFQVKGVSVNGSGTSGIKKDIAWLEDQIIKT